MGDKSLSFGNLITLSITDNCFTYTKGFIDDSIYLQEITDCGEPDFTGLIFRVLPQYAHSIQNDLVNGSRDLAPAAFHDKLLRQDHSGKRTQDEYPDACHFERPACSVWLGGAA